MQIPKIIHQCWLSDEPIPEHFQAWADKWRQLHPEWEYHLWTHKAARPLLKNLGHIYDQAPLVVIQADLARLELIYQFGGVYADMDIEPIKPIDDLLGDLEAFATFESVPEDFDGENHINQAIFGAIPRHGAIKQAMAALANGLAIDGQVLWGVRSFTETMRRRSDVTIFPTATFHPYSFPTCQDGSARGKPVPPYTYGIHWFAATWCDKARELGLFKYPTESVDRFMS